MSRGVPSSLSALRVFVGSDPAAGAEISETVPVGKWWEIITVSVSLVQGLTQTPQPILVIDDGATTLAEFFGASAAQAASTTCRYTWGTDLPLSGIIGAGANGRASAPLPGGLVLPAGSRVRTSTLGIGAATDYGAPTLYVVEYGG